MDLLCFHANYESTIMLIHALHYMNKFFHIVYLTFNCFFSSLDATSSFSFSTTRSFLMLAIFLTYCSYIILEYPSSFSSFKKISLTEIISFAYYKIVVFFPISPTAPPAPDSSSKYDTTTHNSHCAISHSQSSSCCCTTAKYAKHALNFAAPFNPGKLVPTSTTTIINANAPAITTTRMVIPAATTIPVIAVFNTLLIFLVILSQIFLSLFIYPD